MSYSHPKCYAGALGGCSSKISSEHYFSHSLYKILANEEQLTLTGMPWINEGESRQSSPKSLGSNILCETHNRFLSNYDSVALKMLNHLRYETEPNEPIHIGDDIERWYLKALIGMVVANKTAGGQKWKPPLKWLKILYENQPFEPNTGLHVPISGKPLRGAYNGVDMQISYSDPERNNPVGIFVRFGWMASYFGMMPGVGPSDWIMSFHPKSIYIKYPDKTKRVLLPWIGAPAGFNGPIPNDPTQP